MTYATPHASPGQVLDDFLPKREGRVLQAFQETYKEWKTVLEVILPSLWNGTEMLQNQQRLWQAAIAEIKVKFTKREGWRPSLLGWRPLLSGWRPSPLVGGHR